MLMTLHVHVRVNVSYIDIPHTEYFAGGDKMSRPFVRWTRFRICDHSIGYMGRLPDT